MRFIKKILRFLASIIAKSPKSVHNVLAWMVAILWWDVLRIRRSVVIDNLERAFPDLSKDEVLRLGRKSLFHMGLTLVEFCYFPFFSKELLETKVRFQGLEHLDRAHEQGKGVLLLGLHLGNGDLGMMGLAYRGYPVHLISKKFKAGWLNDLWFDLRGRHGTSFISPEKSSFEILKALKSHQRVVFVLDQYMGPPVGVRTRFFGYETGTALGLAVFAERTGAPVIPAYSFRDHDGVCVVEFQEPVPVVRGADIDETRQKTTQAYTDIIESVVRRYPEQWMWLHKRWKPFVE